MKLVRHLFTVLTVLLLARPLGAQIPAQLNYQGRVTVQGVNFTGTGQFKFALVDGGVNLNQTATAAAFATLMVTSISLQSGGSGYVEPPVVTIAPPDQPGGVQATASATIAGGVVTGIAITAAGSGYSTHPLVTIAPPPVNIEYQTYWSNVGDLAPGEVPGSSVPIAVTNGLYSVRLADPALGMAPFHADTFRSVPLFLRVWFSDGVRGFQQLTPDQPLAAAPYAFTSQLALTVPNGSISRFQLADGAVSAAKIAPGAVTAASLGNGAVGASKLAAGAVTPSVLASGAAAANLNAGGNQALTVGAGQFSSLSVSGAADFSGLLQATTLTLTGDLSVLAGNASVRYNLSVQQDLGVIRDLTVGRNVEVNGNLLVNGNIDYVGTLLDISDARLKDLGAPFDAGLDAIAQIEPLHYRFKQDNPLGIPSDPVYVGVSAQALQAALPEAVTERRDGYLGISQEPVVWALVNAVKELKAENDGLRARLERLEQSALPVQPVVAGAGK